MLGRVGFSLGLSFLPRFAAAGSGPVDPPPVPPPAGLSRAALLTLFDTLTRPTLARAAALED